MVLLRRPLRPRSWIVIGGSCATLMFALAVPFGPVSAWLAALMPSWFPSFMLPEHDWTASGAPRGVLVTTAVVSLLLVAIVFPLVEEAYFRGYLLPRTAAHGWWAPSLCAALFAIQHFWQPYNWPLIFALNLILVHLVLKIRNIWLGYVLHALGNTVGAALTLLAVLK